MDQNPYEPPKQDYNDEHDIKHEIIKIIQKNEMGRQGRENFIKTYINNENKPKKDSNVDDGYHITIIQRAFKAIQARARVDKLREEELSFLGMK